TEIHIPFLPINMHEEPKKNYECYGYRRLYTPLKNVGSKLFRKVIRRLMKGPHTPPPHSIFLSIRKRFSLKITAVLLCL
ncbi:MAG: hypothetical protein ACI4ND_06640, partial [Succinivibrio sp.]